MLVREGVEAGGPGQSRTEQVCRAGHQGHGPWVPEEERGGLLHAWASTSGSSPPACALLPALSSPMRGAGTSCLKGTRLSLLSYLVGWRFRNGLLIFKEFSPLLSSGFPPHPPIPLVTSCIATLFSLLSSHPSSSSGSFLQARSPTSSLPQVAASLQDGASGSSASM